MNVLNDASERTERTERGLRLLGDRNDAVLDRGFHFHRASIVDMDAASGVQSSFAGLKGRR